MLAERLSTLERIHQAAKTEFLAKGFQSAEHCKICRDDHRRFLWLLQK